MSSRRTTIEILELYSFLSDNPGLHKITDLAERYNVPRQTIHRWCDYLEKRHHVSIDKSNEDANVPRGYIKLNDSSPKVLNISLTSIEIDALMLAAERVQPLTNLVKETIEKLSNAKRIKNYKKQPSVLHTPLFDKYASNPSEILERVIEAIRDRQVVEIRYHNAKNQITSYKFNSYALMPYNQHLHLIGVTHTSIETGDNTIIRLRLDQIKEFKLTQEHFADPKFDVAGYATKDFGAFSSNGKTQTVKVRFSAEKAQFIRRTTRHSTQKVTDEDDGGVIWNIEAPISEGLVHLIVSYGPHAKVLQPKELKKKVLEWAKGSVTANET